MIAQLHARRAFLPRYLTLLAGEAIGKGCIFVAFMYLARVLGPDRFGQIEFALSFTLFFTLGAESGLGTYAARRLSIDPDGARSLLARVIIVRAALALAGYLAILVAAQAMAPELRRVVQIYGLLVFAAPVFTQWIFQGFHQMHWVALGTATRAVTFLALVLLVVTEQSDPRTVGAIELSAAAALAAVNAAVLHGHWRLSPEWRGAVAGARSLFRDAWPIGASDLTWACLWYAPTVLVGTLAGATEVAWQAAAVRIVFSLHTGVWLYFFNLLPTLTRTLAADVAEWRQLLLRSASLSLWAGGGIALLGTLLAGSIVTIVYGDSYAAAARPLQILVWMIPVAWLSGHFRYSLIAAGHQSWEFAASALTAAFTATASWMLITLAGSTGAAAALLGGGIFNAVVAAIFVRRTIAATERLSALLVRVALAAGLCLVLAAKLSGPWGDSLATAASALVFAGFALGDSRAILRTLRK